MKIKCPKCGTGKARRVCHREGKAEICSQCCASIRDPECGDCVHYESTWNYDARRAISSGNLPDADFLAEYNPEVSAKVEKALRIVRSGDPEQAREILTDLQREHPRHHDVAFGIGCTHAVQGNHETAIEWFDKAITIYPYSLESHYNKALAHCKNLDLPNCILFYQKVVAVGHPDDPEVAAARSFLLKATATVKQNEGISLDTFVKSGKLFKNAFALMQREDWQAALEGFRASLAIHERSASCHGNMALCLAYLGKKAMALAELDRALEIDPDYNPARSNRPSIENMEEGKPMEKKEMEIINNDLESLMKERN